MTEATLVRLIVERLKREQATKHQRCADSVNVVDDLLPADIAEHQPDMRLHIEKHAVVPSGLGKQVVCQGPPR
jgi:hypothetical protein